MAGGKETPRQKMIGMMYLVLTALLALNVSKQVIAAFITLNNKLDASAEIINNKIEGTYYGFDAKRAALVATKGDMKLLDQWEGAANELKAQTYIVIDYLLREANEMIVEADGIDWVEKEIDVTTADGQSHKVVTNLKGLEEISSFDNYDVPTNLFVGGDPHNPVEKGLNIPKKIHEYRDLVCGLMGTYTSGKNEWKFDPAAGSLEASLQGCNPKDTSKIRQVYSALTLPEKLEMHGEGEMPWPSVTFDHAPIVAAAAMFTSLKLDIKNAEAMASDFMLSKVDAPTFNFNKIEPLAFARSSYINQGDSLALSVKIAAYDSNEVSKIRYGMDADTANSDAWKTVTGDIGLPGDKPGPHKIKGQIGVKEKGELSWKNFEYNYTVGQPMGVVAQPEMRVLYWGYDNKVEGTASGFPADKVSLSGSGCSLSSAGGGTYIAKVSRGTRTASISVSGKKEDGGSVSLGKFDFKCKPMPPALIKFGSIESGGNASYTEAKNVGRVTVMLDPSSPLQGVNYTVMGGTVIVAGVPGAGNIERGGALDGKAKSMMNQSKGKNVAMEVKYKGPDGITRIGALAFKVK
ncbi:hypothetical protein K6119_07130 [Paracrocinitomix mangrovi]|uniref:type IX secretion system motor protein PorM/GldM n=1 Tax=Paracrocinitomix mangrovi TaxID=2862509 RepID=UPI001C8EC640|nr:GldM family protein [Paracrocinitomix mangrovi]UKN03285.1 hypothetical protein K6119_07130 [Paracrocinitomix mangrovi]